MRPSLLVVGVALVVAVAAPVHARSGDEHADSSQLRHQVQRAQQHVAQQKQSNDTLQKRVSALATRQQADRAQLAAVDRAIARLHAQLDALKAKAKPR